MITNNFVFIIIWWIISLLQELKDEPLTFTSSPQMSWNESYEYKVATRNVTSDSHVTSTSSTNMVYTRFCIYTSMLSIDCSLKTFPLYTHRRHFSSSDLREKIYAENCPIKVQIMIKQNEKILPLSLSSVQDKWMHFGLWYLKTDVLRLGQSKESFWYGFILTSSR